MAEDEGRGGEAIASSNPAGQCDQGATASDSVRTDQPAVPNTTGLSKITQPLDLELSRNFGFVAPPKGGTH